MGDVTRLTNLTTGGPVHVDVKDGKILRIVPLELDDGDGPSWSTQNEEGIRRRKWEAFPRERYGD